MPTALLCLTPATNIVQSPRTPDSTRGLMRHTPMQLLGFWSLRLATAALLACLPAAAKAQRPDVVYEPTPQETVTRMLNLARVSASDFVIDLGSGDGRIPIAAGRNGARALGVELDDKLLEKARSAAQSAGVAGRVSFRKEDLFRTPLDDATVITLYLLPELNVRLRPRLLSLRPGTRVVSHQFPMGDWRPDTVDDNGGRIYLWIVPANVAGRWQIRNGDQRFTVDLRQQYQEISGTATLAGGTQSLRDARLRGNDIEFSIDLGGRVTRFRGTVAGDAMQSAAGTVSFEQTAGAWQASRQ